MVALAQKCGVQKKASRWTGQITRTDTTPLVARTKTALLCDLKSARQARATRLRNQRNRVNPLVDGLRKWVKGDIRYAPVVLWVWRHFTGYRNRWRCEGLAEWKSAVVEQMRYEAWRNRWENGWGIDPKGVKIMSVWYAQTPAGQISFHATEPQQRDHRVVETDKSIVVAEAEAEIDALVPAIRKLAREIARRKLGAEVPPGRGRGTLERWRERLKESRRIAKWPLKVYSLWEMRFPFQLQFSGEWDGQRNVVAERLANYYDVTLPVEDLTMEEIQSALNKVGLRPWKALAWVEEGEDW